MEGHGNFVIIRPDGWFKIVEAQEVNGTTYLKQLQDAVGGFIECIPCVFEGVDMFINEEGKLNGLKYNVAATAIAKGLSDDYIVGSAILTGFNECDTIPLYEPVLKTIKDRLLSIGYREEVA